VRVDDWPFSGAVENEWPLAGDAFAQPIAAAPTRFRRSVRRPIAAALRWKLVAETDM
jgi:hypothetical protein